MDNEKDFWDEVRRRVRGCKFRKEPILSKPKRINSKRTYLLPRNRWHDTTTPAFLTLNYHVIVRNERYS